MLPFRVVTWTRKPVQIKASQVLTYFTAEFGLTGLFIFLQRSPKIRAFSGLDRISSTVYVRLDSLRGTAGPFRSISYELFNLGQAFSRLFGPNLLNRASFNV